MPEIIFIVQQLSQPRCIKRIQNFRDAGYRVRVYGFANGLYEGNLQQADFCISGLRDINKNDHGVKKFINYINFIRYILKTAKSDDVVYAFGFEIGSIVSFLWKGQYIYEEADISAARVRQPFLRSLLLSVDRKIIRRSILTIFTSEGFYDYLYPRGTKSSENIIFIKNKLNKLFSTEARVTNRTFRMSQINFGFVGLIRYPNTILRFAKIIGKKFPQHNFHFFGGASDTVLDNEDWSQYSNVFMHGEFSNPTDLKKIYSEIDINIACYDPTSGNVKIAEPNKFYESIFFGTPIVVTAGTYVHKRVEALKIGFGINATDDAAIINFVENLTSESIQVCQQCCQQIITGDLVENPAQDMEAIRAYLTW